MHENTDVSGAASICCKRRLRERKKGARLTDEAPPAADETADEAPAAVDDAPPAAADAVVLTHDVEVPDMMVTWSE